MKIGEILNQTYEIKETLGKGGGGEVHKAYHLRLKTDVVLKKIHNELVDKIDIRAEVDILKNLKHSYLPQVYDFLEINNEIFTVMDYIEGRDFENLLNSKEKFSPKDIIKWATQLVEALEYLHQQTPPIIHGDIKPANIMLTKANNICLIDFNISQTYKEGATIPLGFSHGYAAPEQYPIEMKNQIISHFNTLSKSQNVQIKSDKSDKTEILNNNESNIKTEILAQIEETELVNIIGDTEILCQTEILDNQNITPQTDLNKTDVDSDMNMQSPKYYLEKEYVEKELVHMFVAKIDVRTDIYAVGATIYHLITGVKPDISVLGQITLNAQLVSDGLAYLIEKALRYNPNERFIDATDMLKTIRNIYKFDKSYKKEITKQKFIFISLFIGLAISIVTMCYGYIQMGIDRENDYTILVSASTNYISQGNYEQAILTAIEASNIISNDPESYQLQALSLYQQRKFDECKMFIDSILNKASINGLFRLDTLTQQTAYADIFFIYGNCYYNDEDYLNSIICFEQAIAYNPENGEYYRDYAIALAKTNQVDLASNQLQLAISKNLSNEGISLIEAEILWAKQDYTSACDKFSNLITTSNNDIILERSSLSYYEILFNADITLTESIDVLKLAENKLSQSNKIIVTEKIGELYFKLAQETNNLDNYNEAIKCFESVLKLGVTNFTADNNLLILYQMIGDYDLAMEKVLSMGEKYPNNYNVHKQKTLLLLEIENTKPNENRNYSQVKETYQIAIDLYSNTNNANDPQMIMLASLIDDVISGGW